MQRIHAAAGGRLGLPTRQPRTNIMADVRGFLDRWDRGHGRTAGHFALRRSQLGNINSVGAPGEQDAPDLTPHDVQWHDTLEPGIRALVRLVTDELGWVTYTSCEGHATPSPTPDVVAVREIGILPRSGEEEWEIEQALVATMRALDGVPGLDVGHVETRLWENELQCVDTGERFRVFDITFEPGEGSNALYFSEVDRATDRLIETLRRVVGTGAAS